MSDPNNQSATGDPGRQRLQRVLAAAGIASRRKSEELIIEGRVSVDGRVVTELGTTIDPERQSVTVDGRRVRLERQRYILLNKPKGYITTVADERGRQTVMDLIDVPEHVKPVGRLDRPSEGLLLFTNDGELAFRVMHPRYEIEKEYEVTLDGHPPSDALERVRRGITLDGERVVPSVVRPMRNEPDGTVVKIVIHEGRNRVVRRLFEAVDYPVLRLTRTRVGPLQIGTIPRGGWRDLTPGELEQIRQAVRIDDEEWRPAPPPADRQRTDRRPRSGDRRDGDQRGRGGPPSRARRPDERGQRRSGPPERRRDDDRPRRSGGPDRPRDERRDRPSRDRPPGRPPRRADPPSGGPRRDRPPGNRPPNNRRPSNRPPDRPQRRSGPPDEQQPRERSERQDG